MLVLLTVLPTACAETVLVNRELKDHPTVYRLYDPECYEAPCEHPGQVVRMDYSSQVYGSTYEHYLNVYLPFGYDENGTERYPVLYFLHGNDSSQEVLLGDPIAVNVFDHMIENGDMPPCIIAAPSYFYRSTPGMENVDPVRFALEMREEIMPLVEGTYRSYAETADEAGFTASRSMRALCGYSRGSYMTWAMMPDLLDCIRTFLPFSLADEERAIRAIDAARSGEYADDWFIYMACGSEEDVAFYSSLWLTQRLIRENRIRFGADFTRDNFYFLASNNLHQDKFTRCYLYNAFLDGLFRE